MKFSTREQLLKEADQILRKLRQLREMNEAPIPSFLKNPLATLKIKEVDFGKDPKKFAKGYSGSDTRWKDRTMMSKRDAMNIMKQALPSGYNEFRPEIIDKLPSDAKIQIAREGSVCLYVKTNTKPRRMSLKADELDMVGDNTYRIWWD